MDYTLVIEKDEGGALIGSVVELPGCYSEAESLDQLIKNIKQAIKLYLETEKLGHQTQFIGIQKVSLW